MSEVRIGEFEAKEWKCHCGSINLGDTRCGYCKMTLRDYENENKIEDNWKHAIGELILATNMSPAIQSAFIVSLSDIIEIHYRSELTRLIADIVGKKKNRGFPHQWKAVDIEDIEAIAKAWGIER